MKVGIDILEVERIRKKLENPRFMEKCFSASELQLFSEHGMNAQTVTGRFCVKEAFVKALGTGFRNIELTDITTLNDEWGAPYLVLEGNAEKLLCGRKATVSISHCESYATAVVIIEE